MPIINLPKPGKERVVYIGPVRESVATRDLTVGKVYDMYREDASVYVYDDAGDRNMSIEEGGDANFVLIKE